MIKFKGKELMELESCEDCGKRVGRANSCTLDGIILDGKQYVRDKTHYFDEERQPDSKERCHGCGILLRPGNVHHFGCDDERCPKCGEQLITCDCEITELVQGKNGKRVDKSAWKMSFIKYLISVSPRKKSGKKE